MNCINHPDREKVAFCQECGRPLCSECVRRVGAGVYCEADLAAKIGAAAPGAAAGAPPVTPPSAMGANPYGPLEDGLPRPGLAALLGFIPGVGAMYNGQLVKGLIHIAVFAVLVSLADDHGIFGLFVTGWVFYMVIEAYQTAVARRRGTPLPNAFGLNDLGDRLSQRMGVAGPSAAAQDTTYVYTPPSAAGQAAHPAGAPPYTAESATYAAAGANPYTSVPPSAAQNYAAGGNWSAYPPPPPAEAGYVPPAAGSFWCSGPGGLPIGAVWMIVLGVFFFLGTTHLFPFFSGAIFWPLVVVAFGVYTFYRNAQYLPPNDGSARYRSGLLYAARRAWWIVVVGVLLFLNNAHIFTFHYSWPFFLIFAGVWMFLERSLSPRVSGPYVAPPPPPAANAAWGPVVTPPPSDAGTAIVPKTYTEGMEDAGTERTHGEGR